MLVRKGFKFALRPTEAQESAMRQFAGSCRYVWNRALAEQRERFEQGEKRLGYVDMARLLTDWRNDAGIPWLADAPCAIQQQALRDQERAFVNFFAGRAARPRFREKGKDDSFRFPDPLKIQLDQGNARIRFPKLGWVRYRKSRNIEGAMRNVTVSRRGDRWYMSVQTEFETPDSIHPHAETAVGVDLGVARFATLSDGTFIPPLDSFRTMEKRLAREQRKLSHKVRRSSNWRKQKRRLARLHARIADARADFLHKASTALAKSHGVVVLEDLRVSAMSASARGTADAPGCNVRAKAGLNKAILDQGWSEFRRQLEYKLAWHGGQLVVVNPRNTSRMCAACGHIAGENRKTQASFVCVACGHVAHADVNAALNILAAGHAVTACGAGRAQAPATKQEPVGNVASRHCPGAPA
jgi:putative transposase